MSSVLCPHVVYPGYIAQKGINSGDNNHEPGHYEPTTQEDNMSEPQTQTAQPQNTPLPSSTVAPAGGVPATVPTEEESAATDMLMKGATYGGQFIAVGLGVAATVAIGTVTHHYVSGWLK